MFCVSVAQNWAGNWWSPPGMMEISFLNVHAGEEQPSPQHALLCRSKCRRTGASAEQSGAEGNESLFAAL